MLDNIGGGELLLIALVGLFVLGPERLPAAAAWVAQTVRTIKEYATGARDQLRNELGPEYDQLRKPLEDLRSVRDLDPRRAVRDHILSAGEPAAPGRAVAGSAGAVGSPADGPTSLVKGRTPSAERAVPLQPGEPAPFDVEGT